jgi:hypothetical protein
MYYSLVFNYDGPKANMPGYDSIADKRIIEVEQKFESSRAQT